MSFARQRARPGWAERSGGRAAAHPYSRPHFQLHLSANLLPELVENTIRKTAFCTVPTLQLIENKARKNTFYSRAPKVEVYENKGQSAILLAPQTPVFVPKAKARADRSPRRQSSPLGALGVFSASPVTLPDSPQHPPATRNSPLITHHDLPEHPDCSQTASLVVSWWYTERRTGRRAQFHRRSRLLNFRALLCALILVAVALAMPSCGGVVNNPSPHITTLLPSSANAGATGFTLTVNGSGFAPQSAILWNGAARGTMFLAGNQLITQILPSDLATAGTVTVQVSTPSPGGGNSNTLNFTINPVASLVPQVSSISPSGTFAGGSGLVLQVTGSNFVPRSIVTINNNNRQTAFVNATTLQAGILSTDIAAACPTATVKCPQIGVLTPAPGGGASNTVTLTVANPPPLLATLSPTATQAAGSNITLTVNGIGFDMASVINFNGIPFDGTNGSPTTTFVSNTQLTVSLATADLAAAGTVPVTVVNPVPGGGTANTLPFSITPTSTGVGLPELVDVANDGTQASNGIGDATVSGPAIDSSGEFVAFASISENLVSNDSNGVADIFFRDTCLGVTMNCTPKTTLVSLTSTGAQANGPSSQPSMDSSGQFVAFTSTATNLVAAGTFTGKQVYLRGVCHTARSGCVVSTSLISVATDGLSPANSDASQPAISPDGRFVAFTSAASNLVTGVMPALGITQIYLYDTCHGAPVSSGCKPSMILVSSPDGAAPANGASSQAAVGTGGQFISFTSTATNLGPANPSADQEIFVRNTCLGAASGCTPITTLVSSPDVTTPPTTLANGPSAQSAISSNGRFITFASTATNLCPAAAACSGTQQIFLRDTCVGVSSGCTPGTSLVSIATDGAAGNALSERPVVDSTGQFVAFASCAGFSSGCNLVTGGTNGFEQIFVRNTCAGVTGTCTAATALASVTAPSGTPPTTAPGNNSSVIAALSGNGHFASFISLATNLVANDTNSANDVFLAITTF